MLATESKRNEAALKAVFRKGLNSELCKESACRDDEASLDTLIDLVIRLDNMLHDWQLVTSLRYLLLHILILNPCSWEVLTLARMNETGGGGKDSAFFALLDTHSFSTHLSRIFCCCRTAHWDSLHLPTNPDEHSFPTSLHNYGTNHAFRTNYCRCSLDQLRIGRISHVTHVTQVWGSTHQ